MKRSTRRTPLKVKLGSLGHTPEQRLVIYRYLLRQVNIAKYNYNPYFLCWGVEKKLRLLQPPLSGDRRGVPGPELKYHICRILPELTRPKKARGSIWFPGGPGDEHDKRIKILNKAILKVKTLINKSKSPIKSKRKCTNNPLQ